MVTSPKNFSAVTLFYYLKTLHIYHKKSHSLWLTLYRNEDNVSRYYISIYSIYKVAISVNLPV